MAFTHFNSSRFFDNTCSLQSHQRQCPQKCFNHFCVTTILGSANKEEPCVSVARKECWPYACESPWRRMLFNMPSSTTRGRRSKHIPPSDLVYVSIWWTRERGSETKGDGEGAEKDDDDAFHFSLSSPVVFVAAVLIPSTSVHMWVRRLVIICNRCDRMSYKVIQEHAVPVKCNTPRPITICVSKEDVATIWGPRIVKSAHEVKTQTNIGPLFLLRWKKNVCNIVYVWLLLFTTQ